MQLGDERICLVYRLRSSIKEIKTEFERQRPEQRQRRTSAGLLLVACLATFLIQSETTCLGIAPRTVAWGFLHQLVIEKSVSTGISTSLTERGNSSVEESPVVSSRQKLTNIAKNKNKTLIWEGTGKVFIIKMLNLPL